MNSIRASRPSALRAAALLLASAAPLGAQWSSDPALNTPIAVQPGDQTVPQIAAGRDGGTWVGWFDNRSGSYAVYVQHLDRDGVETLPLDGLQVSSHPQNSSLIGWDLQADAEGNALLAFTDVRAGGDLDVYAYKLSPTGQFLWGANGVTVSTNGDFDANPVLAELADGSVAIAWARIPSTAPGAIHVQRRSAAGALLGESTLVGAAGEKPAFCALVASDNGSCIVQWLRNTASFSSLRHVRAMKFDANGAALWNGGTPVTVFDLASVPIAHQPLLCDDGAGGAWLAWHAAAGSSFSSYAQHLDASGAELFGHNGVSVSIEAGVQQLSPSLAPLPGGEAIVVFNRRNSAQSQWGVGAQRLAPNGARLWTDTGVEIAALDGNNESFERALPFGDGALALFFDNPQTPLPSARVRAARVRPDGTLVWLSGSLSVSANVSPKDDLEVVIDRTGVARAAWRDERTDSGDIFGQSLHPDGALGTASACVTTPFCVGAPNSVGPGARLVVEGSTSLGWSDFELVASGCPPASNGLFFYAAQQIAPSPFFAGFLCLTPPLSRLPTVTSNASGVARFSFDPQHPPGGAMPIGAGTAWGFQYWYRDAAASGPKTNTSDGAWSFFCP
jgi:hypothetical protein